MKLILFFVTFVLLSVVVAFAQPDIIGGIQPETDKQLSKNPVDKLLNLLIQAQDAVAELSQSEDNKEINPFMRRAVDRINEAAVRMYRQLPDENIIFSPLSLYQAFALVYLGAKENTAEQFRNVLDLDLFAPEYDFNSPELQSANAVWLLDDKVKLSPLFFAKVNKSGRDVFRTIKPDNALAVINDWFNKKTQGRVPKLFDQLDKDATFIVGNAVYFKAVWEEQFEEEFTNDKPFYNIDGTEQKVKMMHHFYKMPYYKGKNYAAAALPYQNGRYSMTVIVPDKETDFKKFNEQSLITVPYSISASSGNWSNRSVQLSLPKFELESSFDLKTVLKTLGVTDAFDNRADFSGMTDGNGQPLKIGQAVQKASITVNEEGTVAAAATGLGILMKGAEMPDQEPAIFNVDRPFIFMITDNETGLIVFIGNKTHF